MPTEPMSEASKEAREAAPVIRQLVLDDERPLKSNEEIDAAVSRALDAFAAPLREEVERLEGRARELEGLVSENPACGCDNGLIYECDDYGGRMGSDPCDCPLGVMIANCDKSTEALGHERDQLRERVAELEGELEDERDSHEQSCKLMKCGHAVGAQSEDQHGVFCLACRWKARAESAEAGE